MDKGKIMLAEFIECYKRNRLLWDVSLPDYQKRGKKQVALEELVDIMRQFKMSATVEDVKKKINTLRCSYRKEMKRRQEAEELGEPYRCNIWWLPLMNFIEQTKGRNVENMDDETTIYEEITITPKKEKLRTPLRSKPLRSIKNKKNALKRTLIETSRSNESYSGKYEEYLDITPNYEEVLIPTKTKKHSNLAAIPTTTTTIATKESMEKVSAPSISSIPARRNIATQNNISFRRNVSMRQHSTKATKLRYDHFDYLTKIWANKLRKISGSQLLLAEKAINDILFEAEMGTLKHKTSLHSKPVEVPSVNYVVNIESSSVHAESENGGESLEFIERHDFESD